MTNTPISAALLSRTGRTTRPSRPRGQRLRIVALRIVTLLAIGASLMLTAFVLIPVLGVFVSAQTGVTARSSLDAFIALWVVPFLFLSVVLTIGVLLWIRWLWAVSRSRVAAMRSSHAGAPESSETPSASARPTRSAVRQRRGTSGTKRAKRTSAA